MKQPESVGRHYIRSEIGRGGVLIVYLGCDPFSDHGTAMKVSVSGLINDTTVLLSENSTSSNGVNQMRHKQPFHVHPTSTRIPHQERLTQNAPVANERNRR